MTDLANVQKKKKQKVNVAGYLFILPAMFFFCLYILYPIFFIIKNSLFKWATLSNMEFVGLNNFLNVFKDSTFWITMKNSILWILVTLHVQAILGFFLAYAIEERIRSKKADGKSFSRTFYRTLFFIPVVTSVTVVAIMFSKIFQPYQGIIGHYLSTWFGMSPTINVLGNQKVALWGIMLANIWEWTGWSMIMYIGGISQIPDDIKEAVRIDGANTWQEIRYVFIPGLVSVHKSLLMLGIIGSLQTYRNARYLHLYERFYREPDGLCMCYLCSSSSVCTGTDIYTGKIPWFRRLHEERGISYGSSKKEKTSGTQRWRLESISGNYGDHRTDSVTLCTESFIPYPELYF